MATTSHHVSQPLKDLKITIERSTLVISLSTHETQRRTMFLSNIDHLANTDVELVFFFGTNPEFPPQVVFSRIENSLGKLLSEGYDFLGGRIKPNPELERLEIDCNNEGVGFVDGRSECRLDEVGDLVRPNPEFNQLVTNTIQDGDQPICIFQLTSFKCGGFAMGIYVNHLAFDGLGFKSFLQNLAAVAWEKPLAVIPCNDRELLMARSPPRVSFPRPELEQNKLLRDGGAPQDWDHRVFTLSPHDISTLKAKAVEGRRPSTDNNNNNNAIRKVTTFSAVSAHIWRCRALSSGLEESNSSENLTTILYAMDKRSRLSPPLPSSYAGNAIMTPYATIKRREIEEAPLSRLVDLILEGRDRITDEYIRSVIDWWELYKFFPKPKAEFVVSTWIPLGFHQVEYPWGKPRFSCPMLPKKNVIVLFSDVVNESSSGEVNVLVTLPYEEMARFEAHFYKF